MKRHFDCVATCANFALGAIRPFASKSLNLQNCSFSILILCTISIPNRASETASVTDAVLRQSNDAFYVVGITHRVLGHCSTTVSLSSCTRLYFPQLNVQLRIPYWIRIAIHRLLKHPNKYPVILKSQNLFAILQTTSLSFTGSKA